VRHITTVTCVAVSGEDLIPYIITSQKSKPLEDKLKKRGIEFGLDMTITGSQKPSVKGKTFAEYIESVLLLYVAKIGNDGQIERKDVMLSIDN
jgi:hypothetical protein